jgi:TolB-like protein
MPFENEGAATDVYFADGLSDEVRGKLSNLPSLRVTARSSSSEYKATHKAPRDIGKELGVQYLLSGTVRWDKRGGDARVRVSPELILATDASTVWQAPFDAPLNDVFRVQTQIAEQVAQALKLVLRTGDQATLAQRPTQDLPAYDAFLRGEEISGSLTRTDANTLREATLYYQQAVDLDSTFVVAWLQLTRAHTMAFVKGYDPSPSRREVARQAFERVAALRPDGYERHWAGSAYYGFVLNDQTRGRQENLAALRLAPRHPDLLRIQASYEMNAGQWDSALAHLRRAAEVDPRSVNTLSSEAGALMLLRRYPAATVVAQQTLALDSTNLESWQRVATAHVAEGDLAAAEATTHAAATRLGSIPVAAYWSTYSLSWLLDPPLQRAISTLRPAAYSDDTTSWGSALWSTLLLMGDTARARIYSDSAKLVQERIVAEDSTNFDQRQHLARMLAVAGLADRARREAGRALTQAEAAGDPSSIAYVHDRVARTLLLLGRKDEALDHLTAALAGPFFVTRAWAKLDPDFRPLRGNPRFERLLSSQ